MVPEIRNLNREMHRAAQGTQTPLPSNHCDAPSNHYDLLRLPPNNTWRTQQGIQDDSTQTQQDMTDLDQMDFVAPYSDTTKVTVSVPGFLERLYSILRDNSTSLVNLTLVLIILLRETLFDKTLFTCPCDKSDNKLYGIMFVVAPAVALYVIGIVLFY